MRVFLCHTLLVGKSSIIINTSEKIKGGGSKVEKSTGSTGLQVLKVFIKTADATVIEKTLLEMVPEKSPQQGNVILWAASIYQSNLKFKCDHNY